MLLPLTLALVFSCSVFAFDHPRMEFEKFKLMHSKSYASLEEEETRFGHFMNNLEKIEQHNSEGHSWRMGVTKFADLSKYVVSAHKSFTFCVNSSEKRGVCCHLRQRPPQFPGPGQHQLHHPEEEGDQAGGPARVRGLEGPGGHHPGQGPGHVWQLLGLCCQLRHGLLRQDQ